MASLGHVMVGMAAARLYRRGQPTASPVTVMALWSGLSLLPDADVIGFPMGIAYGAPWGHRGATHSLVFAAAIAVVVGLVAKGARLAALRTALIAWAVVTSHGLLDALTDGGRGCALLWPFSHERFFASWRPLPVAPIGRGLLSMEGLRVAAIELVVFSPFLIYALWPGKVWARPPRHRTGKGPG
jgi:inner membrane protein